MGVKQTQRWTLAVVIATTIACGFAAVAVQLIQNFNEEIRPFSVLYWPALLLSVAGFCFFALLSVVSLDILRLKPADSLPFATLRESYKTIRKAHYYGPRFHKKFLSGCADVPKVQEKILLELINHNKDTAYGKDHRFEQIGSVLDFQKHHPVVSYKNIKSYIDRIAEGEKNVLTKLEPAFFAKTSGTTGQPKLLPITMYKIEEYVRDMTYSFAYMPVAMGAKLTLGKSVVLGHKPQVDTTKSGHKAAPLTFFYTVHSRVFTSPKDVFSLTHENTAFYVHAVFALQEREVGSMRLLFAHQAYSFFTYVEEHWESLCTDIERGTITRDGLTIDDTLYHDIETQLKADPDRADELRKEFEKGSVCLARRLWPGLELCFVTTTGSMAVYKELITKTFLKDVLLVQNAYGGSEGFYGINLQTVTHNWHYILAYPYTFIEFIPEDKIEEEQPPTVLAHEVQEGQNYELVVTNGNGLCRYRIDDVVKISKFIGQCPVMELLYRSGQILNLLGEKTSHGVFYKALCHATENLGVTLIDYTTCEDIHLHDITDVDGYRRHYVLFIELDRLMSQKETEQFDQSLCEQSQIYGGMRKNRQSVTGMEVIQVKRGSFLKLKDRMIQESQNPQFKMPRSLRIKEHLQFLLDHRF